MTSRNAGPAKSALRWPSIAMRHRKATTGDASLSTANAMLILQDRHSCLSFLTYCCQFAPDKSCEGQARNVCPAKTEETLKEDDCPILETDFWRYRYRRPKPMRSHTGISAKESSH